MKWLIPMLLAAASPAQYTTTLHFPDNSIEICPTTSFVIEYLALDVQVTACYPDLIFANGFE